MQLVYLCRGIFYPLVPSYYLQLRDCELRAIVNRDLKQRVRPVSGLVNHKQAIKAYIKLAAKIIQNIDSRWNPWKKDDEKEGSDKEQVSLCVVGYECIGYVL